MDMNHRFCKPECERVFMDAGPSPAEVDPTYAERQCHGSQTTVGASCCNCGEPLDADEQEDDD